MVLRVFGLKEEASYGNLANGLSETSASTIDFHRRIGDGNFKLNDDPVTSNDGSRMVQSARAGAVKPTGSTSGKCDLERIGHYFKAFFDEYRFTGGEEIDDEDDPWNEHTFNTHEFWGREGQYLTSFHGWATFDFFEKIISGLLLDTLKLEVSSDYMNQSEEWIYQNEKIRDSTSTPPFNQSTYTVREVEGEIPLMFYDINLQLNNTAMQNVVFTNFTFEGKNNLNQDGTLGMGSRFPQRQASAQKREINISIGSFLAPETLDLIKGAEYGDVQNSPSLCKIFTIPVKVTIKACENNYQQLDMYFPKCTVAVEYSASESEEIETTFNLVGLGSGDLTAFTEFASSNPLEDEDDNPIQTDCYCKLINLRPKIGPNAVNA